MSINRISAGSFDLNKWHYGGYEKEIITMIVGPPGCGKTNLCILTACSQAKKGNKIIFIDTEAGFSVERVRQIVGENYENILENILLLEPTNFEEQKKCFLKLLNRIKKEHVGLIVVDGMAMFYRLELGDAVKLQDDDKIKQVNREVAKQMRVLAEIARKQKIPVIITNQVYTGFLSREDGDDVFVHYSAIENDGGYRTLDEGDTVEFEVTEGPKGLQATSVRKA